MNDKKQFIKDHPIELSLPLKEAKALRKIIILANESHPIEHTEELGVKAGKLQYYDFRIWAPVTTYAQAYFHFGILYAKHILPIWQSRFEKKPKKKPDNKKGNRYGFLYWLTTDSKDHVKFIYAKNINKAIKKFISSMPASLDRVDYEVKFENSFIDISENKAIQKWIK